MKILIAYDGSIYANAAIDDLQWAGLPLDAQAIVISVVEEHMSSPRNSGLIEADFGSDWIARAERWEEEACNRLSRYFPQWDIQLETRWGSPAVAVLEKARNWPADLVVLGTHGRSTLVRAVLGSVSLKLVHEALCSVRVGRASKHDGPIRVLVGNDGSSSANAAVKEVCSRTWPAGTEVRVSAIHEVLAGLHSERIVVGPGLYSEMNENARDRLSPAAEFSGDQLRKAGLAVSSTVEEGDPKKCLVNEARTWNADAIFVGARGLGRMERLLLGSVSSAVVAHAPCTVEVVRDRPKS
jgi:nucleotide-binding universal stress UspA family protein